MKTVYSQNGMVLTRGCSISFAGGDVTFITVYDGDWVLVEDDGARKWLPASEFNITSKDVAECWHFNYLTGRELAVGDEFPDIRNTHVCREAGENPRFSCSSGMVIDRHVSRIPNPEGLDTMPVPADSRIVDGVVQRDVGHGGWTPVSCIGYVYGIRYDTRAFESYRQSVYLIADMVESADGRIPKSASVTDHHGVTHLASQCEIVDGRFYRRSTLHRLINGDGIITGYSVTEPDGYVYCPSHYGWAPEDEVTECSRSGEPTPCECGQVFDGDFCSDNWLSNNTFVCEGCDERFHDYDDAGDCHCSDCYKDENADRYGVTDYCNRSANNLPSEKDVPIKFGIELEVEPINGRGASVKAFKFPSRYVVLKEDGSLNDDGFEIVTRPDCPSVHKRIFEKVLSDEAVRRTTTSWKSSNCGIHIHVSRAPLSQLWVGRILVLINSPAMREVVSKVAGRYGASYACINEKNLTSGKHSSDRYDAVNVSGSRTIEFRIFRGTLKKESFLKNVEFVESVLAYTRPAQCGNRGFDDPKKFVDFVKRHKKDWPNLYSFLLEKGLAVK